MHTSNDKSLSICRGTFQEKNNPTKILYSSNLLALPLPSCATCTVMEFMQCSIGACAVK